MTIRVSILSDDVFFCEGLRRVLDADGSCRLVEDQRLQTSAADIMLVDSRMEGALASSAKADSTVRPYRIFLTVSSDNAAVDALFAGARGVVRRTEPIGDVIRAIRHVHGGSVWAPRHVVVEAWLRQHRRGAGLEARLSAREYEVVRLVASGMSNKELAGQLGISLATVKAHLTSVFQKLSVSGRGELLAAYHGTLASGARERFSAGLIVPSASLASRTTDLRRRS